MICYWLLTLLPNGSFTALNIAIRILLPMSRSSFEDSPASISTTLHLHVGYQFVSFNVLPEVGQLMQALNSSALILFIMTGSVS